MQRNLLALANNKYDVLVIGGGIYGACVAWEATLRGLSVALVEKTDFSAATSANSLKIIHGGLRYLQHADIKRARESICERKILMQIAPHLIHPLPVLLPTYGHGLKGRELFALGLFVNDLIGFDRNLAIDPQKHLPKSKTISKQACLELLPSLNPHNVTGGAIFHDAQVYNSERLPLAFIRSAAETGAQIANYVRAVNFLQTQDRIRGIRAKDVLTGQRFDIRAKMVINTAGPWMNQVLNLANRNNGAAPVRFAKAFNLVTRQLFQEYAVGISGQSRYQDSDSVINKGSRFFFAVPWRGKSLVGTEYHPFDGHPDDLVVTEAEIAAFIEEINQAYPAAQLTLNDVHFVHKGLVPMTGYDPATGSVQLTKHYQITDEHNSGISGLISVVGVKYTTARNVAETVLDRVFEIWRKPAPASTSATTSIYGGHIDQLESYLETAVKESLYNLNVETLRRLIYNYGSAYEDVLSYFSSAATTALEQSLVQAQVKYSIREEMAIRLADVIFRRTELGSAGHPGQMQLRYCAKVMGAELGWDQARINQEVEAVNQRFACVFNEYNVTKQLAGPAVQ